jgi:hypothetical protein
MPWRSAALGWLATAALLLAGVPLFLRMPLWCDATLYDVAARNLLRGGTHYKDVFDTNPPGFVWLLCGVRATLGWSPEAARAVDLAAVAAITVLLLRWAAAAGAPPAARAWTAAAVAAFYPFVTEFCHLQRDVWLMLPALLAVRARVRRVARGSDLTNAAVFRSAFGEGVLWGLAFWIKPHVAIPAVAVWLASAARLAGASARPCRRLVADLLGVLAGGLAVGAAGVAWLVASGTCRPFLDVFTNWNTSYLQMIAGELDSRLDQELSYFPPWSAFLLGAVPLAVCNLVAGRVWSRKQAADYGPRFARAVLAAAFLGWAGMALFFQRGFHYAHVPEVLLMLALFAANRWPAAFAVLALQVVTGIWMVVLLGRPDGAARDWELRTESWAYQNFVSRHPLFDSRRMAWWPRCFSRDVPRELRRDVGFQVDDFGGIDPVELGAVEDFLRAQGVRGTDVIGWHNTTHPLYLSLNLDPPIRFMHLSTVVEIGEKQYQIVKAELSRATPHARFVVSDLHRITYRYDLLGFDHLNPTTGLPAVLPYAQLDQFPFNQPVVFRSPNGRYLVHAVRHPTPDGGWDCMIPGGLANGDPE